MEELLITISNPASKDSLLAFLTQLDGVQVKRLKLIRKKKKDALAEARAFYASVGVDMSNFKFDRDEANER